MSYLVLARKWRPTTFEDVVGQEHVTRTLSNAVLQDRVAHALLFTGSRGVGKTSCARILAKALNCAQAPTTTPCGECTSCVEITAGTSIDVFEIDGASNNSVEQIREIREAIKLSPMRGKRKIYIIDEVHMLTTSAFNALLKTLEEPPAHALFIFATTEPHKIPETILSRCQRFDFKRIAEAKIIGALSRIGEREGLNMEPGVFAHIAREAKGGMRDSLSLLDQIIAFCGVEATEAQVRGILGIADRSTLHELTQALIDGNGRRALELVEELFQFGLDLQKFAAELVKHLRDLMVIKVTRTPGQLVDLPESELEAMARQVEPLHPAQLHRLFAAMLKSAEEIARSSFPKLVLEMTLLRLCAQGQTLPLSEVLEGIARLEARLEHQVPPEAKGGGGDHGPFEPRAAQAQPEAPTPQAAPMDARGAPPAEGAPRGGERPIESPSQRRWSARLSQAPAPRAPSASPSPRTWSTEQQPAPPADGCVANHVMGAPARQEQPTGPSPTRWRIPERTPQPEGPRPLSHGPSTPQQPNQSGSEAWQQRGPRQSDPGAPGPWQQREAAPQHSQGGPDAWQQRGPAPQQNGGPSAWQRHPAPQQNQGGPNAWQQREPRPSAPPSYGYDAPRSTPPAQRPRASRPPEPQAPRPYSSAPTRPQRAPTPPPAPLEMPKDAGWQQQMERLDQLLERLDDAFVSRRIAHLAWLIRFEDRDLTLGVAPQARQELIGLIPREALRREGIAEIQVEARAPEGAVTVLMWREARARARLEARREEARQDPGIRAIFKVFEDAQIESIRVKEEEPKRR